jgi:hypothetical protein
METPIAATTTLPINNKGIHLFDPNCEEAFPAGLKLGS